MTAVDTNVLLRLITGDNESQGKRAIAFVESQERIFIPKTVLLELEWVLRSGYRYSRPRILEVFQNLLGTRNLEVEDELTVFQAMEWCKNGMDFADSLHLASAGSRNFATFDAALRKRALRLRAGRPVAV